MKFFKFFYIGEFAMAYRVRKWRRNRNRTGGSKGVIFLGVREGEIRKLWSKTMSS